MSSMAGSALPSPQSEPDSGLPEPLTQKEKLQRHCAKLYGQGLTRSQIARAMVDYLAPNKERPLEQRMSNARQKLRNWEKTEHFRDLVWNLAVVELDMSTPQILRGIGRSAKRGRVDAAKLALEITGRHVPKGDHVAPNIVIAFNGIPRPAAPERQLVADIEAEAEEIVEEDK